MPSRSKIVGSFLLLSAGLGACSGSGSGATDDSGTGGEPPASAGGAANAGGSSVLPPGGAAASGGNSAAAGTGAGVSGGVGGGMAAGTAGTGGSAASVGGSAQSQAGNGAGGSVTSGGSTGVGGANASGGSNASGGNTASGGTGGKLDQSSLPAISVHLAGDSTMSNYAATTTQEGWGQELGQYFIAKVTIDNQAEPGSNIQTFYSGHWKTLIANVKAGDYVFAAFGINDSGTTHGPVTPAAFQTQMGVMADEVAAKKATFIPTTSSPLQVWVGGKETNARLQPYCDATIALGKMKGLLVDDLNARGTEYYNVIGMTAAAALTFNGDKAHFDKAGATEMALLASKELTRIDSPLAAYLK